MMSAVLVRDRAACVWGPRRNVPRFQLAFCSSSRLCDVGVIGNGRVGGPHSPRRSGAESVPAPV
eukprot:5497015-Prymnesium_polylepis.1